MEYFYNNYKNESPLTIRHISLHAIHVHTYLKFFNEERMERDIKIEHNDYVRAWEIIQKEVHENIVRELMNRTKD